MKRLDFIYCMTITYSEPVSNCHYTLKCVPADMDRQRIESLKIEVMPENYRSRGQDSFGNQMVYGTIEKAHDVFSCRVCGTAVTGCADSNRQRKGELPGMYLNLRGLTAAGKELESYCGELAKKLAGRTDGTPYGQAVKLMQCLYEDFRYEKNCTNVTTTSEDAWRLKRGVCQDYAHILISLCRMNRIPARYAAGFMLGEGESHAWVEVLWEGKWYGLDPTNNQLVNEDYIYVGIGRDAADCALNRGIVVGGGQQCQQVAVAVKEI